MKYVFWPFLTHWTLRACSGQLSCVPAVQSGRSSTRALKPGSEKILPCRHFIEHVARGGGGRGWLRSSRSRWWRRSGGCGRSLGCACLASRGAVPRCLALGLCRRRRRRRAAPCTRAFDPRRGGNHSCVGAVPRRHEEGASGRRPRGGSDARVWRGRRLDCAGAGAISGGDRIGRGWRGAGGAVHRRSCAGGRAEGERREGTRESGRRGREISQRLRVSSESGRARRSTKIPAPDCAECSAAVFLYSPRNYTASAGRGYSARAG
jgi:hypothetical protein